MAVGGFSGSSGSGGVGRSASSRASGSSWSQDPSQPAAPVAPPRISNRPMELAGQAAASTLPSPTMTRAEYPQITESYFRENFPDNAALYDRQQSDAFAQKVAEGYYGPQQVMTDQAQEMNANRLGLLNFDFEYQQSAMKRDAGLARRKLELERGLANGQLGNVGKLKALAAEQLANQKADFANSRAKTRDTAKRQQWDLRSDLTQRGAFNTVANERGTGRIARDELYNLQALNVQEQGADIGYRQGMVGYDNQTLQLQNQLSNIGLNGEKVAYDLENALHNSGIGHFGNFWSLMEASQSLDAQEAGIANQVLQMVGGMAGLTPEMIQALMGSMGQSGGGGGAQPVPYKSPRVQ